MLFASDLDQTLIYSKRFIPKGESVEIHAVESKKLKPMSYMTKVAIESLKQLTCEVMFIPVTTRTIEQYKRIFLLTEDIKPKYAIVSNGGNLLVRGQVDTLWKNILDKKLREECLGMEEVHQRFQEIHSDEWVIDHRKADGMFSYCIVDRSKVPFDEIEDFKEWLNENNWSVSLQGRKLYFVPQCICKGAAISHIKEREGYQTMAAAGDSLLDLPMLEMADYALCPPHGELNRFITGGGQVQGEIQITKKEGIFASEEIIEKAKALLEK